MKTKLHLYRNYPAFPLFLFLVLLFASSFPSTSSAASIDPALLEAGVRETSGKPGSLEDISTTVPELSGMVVSEDGRTWVDMWVRGRVSRSQIESLGGIVGTEAGDVMTVKFPLDAVNGLIGLEGLEQVQLAQKMDLQTNVSIPAIGADDIWGGLPPMFSPSGQTGSNVVVGIVDTGIDPTHEDFKTSSGTRIKYLWDQTILGVAPSGFTYGTEYTASNINAGLYLGYDTDGHGTLIAGIAAGNGRATGNGVPQYTYTGTAPEADLVIVKLLPFPMGGYSDAKIVDGVDYVFRKAQALGKPAVVLLAIGKMYGPHDGTDPHDLAISALTGPGKIVVAAAGNYNGKARHAEWSTTGSSQDFDMTMSIGTYSPSATAADHFNVEAWYNSGANYDVTIIAPNGTAFGPISRGQTMTVAGNSGLVKMYNGQYQSSNGSYRVNLDVYRGSLTYPVVASGTWTFRFTSRVGGVHRVDAWITDYLLGTQAPVFVSKMTESRLVCSPATATNVISVGAYSTKRTWVDMNGVNRSYFYAVMNQIANYSSPGPRRDDLPVPSITAPGFGVVGALSAQSLPPDSYKMPDLKHRINNGTSVAAAHVAGGVALFLEASPNLTGSSARLTLQNRALSDQYTGPCPNPLWGAGKLRLEAPAQSAVGDGVPARPFRLSASPNPSVGPTTFAFEAPSGPEFQVPYELQIVDVNGREVTTLRGSSAAGPQGIVWDGLSGTGHEVVSGVYLARLRIGDQADFMKIVRKQ